MEGLSWKCLALIVIGLCHAVLSIPIPQENAVPESSVDVNPLNLEENNYGDSLDREKRKLPEAAFGAKNAILGYVFGKIDSILDAKTQLIASLDQANIAKNKEYGIEPPKPINSLQSLIQAVISPKIAAITSKFSALSGSSSSSSAGLSLGGGAGADTSGIAGDDDDADDDSGDIPAGDAAGGSAGGVGGLFKSVLKLSGPILSSSSSSAKGGGNGDTASADDDSDE